VRWLDRHALATMPERIDQPGAAAMGEQLLTIVDGDVLVLILDMTATAECDHAGGDMLARVYHRAVARGTGLRLVATGEKVRRVLTPRNAGSTCWSPPGATMTGAASEPRSRCP
jgi:anti-anti-sigma regulatory factor